MSYLFTYTSLGTLTGAVTATVLLASGQTVAEVRSLLSPDGEAGGQKAIAAEDLDGDGERELVVGYQGPEQMAGVFIAHRTPQGWQKVWQKEKPGPPGLDVLELEDLHWRWSA